MGKVKELLLDQLEMDREEMYKHSVIAEAAEIAAVDTEMFGLFCRLVHERVKK